MKTTLGFKVDIEFAKVFKQTATDNGMGHAEYLMDIFAKISGMPPQVLGVSVLEEHPPNLYQVQEGEVVAISKGVLAQSVSTHARSQEAFAGHVGIVNMREVQIQKRRKMRGDKYNKKLEQYF